MEFAVSASGSFEPGPDWVALLRDSLIGLGHRVDSSFDAGQFLTDPIYANNRFPVNPRAILTPRLFVPSALSASATTASIDIAAEGWVPDITPNNYSELNCEPNTHVVSTPMQFITIQHPVSSPSSFTSFKHYRPLSVVDTSPPIIITCNPIRRPTSVVGLFFHISSNTARTLLSDLDLIPKATSSILRDQIAAHLDTESEMDVDDAEQIPAIPWLDDRCPEPPMPMANTPYSSLLINPESIGTDPETEDPVIAPELKDLTVVEEAMIARCRAKCWIIQLRDDGGESSIPTTQRGVRGHIIIHPQKPSTIAKVLPLPIADIITPICVVFVGSKPPTMEWLKEKARPLVVRKEKVQKALNWLKIHSYLYADVEIDQQVINELPIADVLPFHIQHVIPNAGIDSTTSDYVPGSSIPTDTPSITPQLSDILSPAPSTIPFQSVVVADVEGNAPSNVLRAAALEHMCKAGSNYVEIPHGPKPENEFNNPHLFPMMYPTPFPYGLDGLEDKSRRSRLGFKRRVKHLFRSSSFCSLDNREPFRAEITGILKSAVNLTDGNQLVILGPRGGDNVLYADQQQSLARVVDVERGRNTRLIVSENMWVRNNAVMITTCADTVMNEVVGSEVVEGVRAVHVPKFDAQVGESVRFTVFMKIDDICCSVAEGCDVYDRASE
ncbi:hypothetical protein B0H13DRAFT_2306998 [Mycena leptocephala]|nr:hypothetical protein B0H13DRAFT_2306998 [Mycena leptocephala]